MALHKWFCMPEHLSPTSATCFSRCPRRWMYRRMGLESPGLKSAMLFGEAFHHGASLAAEGRLNEAIAAFDKIWKDEAEDDKRTRSAGHTILKDFCATHSGKDALYKLFPPPIGVQVPERVSEWEVPFAIDIGIPVPIVGRIDGVGKHRDDGGTWAIEYKTTSQLGAMFLSNFGFDPQIVTYALALSMNIPQSVEGTIVDGILVAKTKVESLRIPIYVSSFMIATCIQWYKDIWNRISACVAAEDFPLNISACSPYPGFGMPGFVCEYQPMCLAGGLWEGMLGLYVHKEPREFEILNSTPK